MNVPEAASGRRGRVLILIWQERYERKPAGYGGEQSGALIDNNHTGQDKLTLWLRGLRGVMSCYVRLWHVTSCYVNFNYLREVEKMLPPDGGGESVKTPATARRNDNAPKKRGGEILPHHVVETVTTGVAAAKQRYPDFLFHRAYQYRWKKTKKGDRFIFS